jgi:hypothetical protein
MLRRAHFRQLAKTHPAYWPVLKKEVLYREALLSLISIYRHKCAHTRINAIKFRSLLDEADPNHAAILLRLREQEEENREMYEDIMRLEKALRYHTRME